MPGVSVVTLSYGEPEYLDISRRDLARRRTSRPRASRFLPRRAITEPMATAVEVADNYPAASPNVVSVGGTSIVIDAAGDYPGTGEDGETGWGYGTISGERRWQRRRPEHRRARALVADRRRARRVSIAIDARAVPDVAMDSGVAQEYDVFTSTL